MSTFGRKATADRAEAACSLARALSCGIRGAEERSRATPDSDRTGPLIADFAALGALADLVADRVNEIAEDLHD
jgi:hypothetical protein